MNYRREIAEFLDDDSGKNEEIPLTVKCRICKKDINLQKAEKTGGGKKRTLFTCKRCLMKYKREKSWEKVQGFLRACRTHSAPYTTAIMFMIYLSSSEDKLLWMSILLPFILFLTHMFSYGHNSIVDTMLGYDENDSNKQHGYVNGTLDKHKGFRNINWLFVALGTITLAVSFFALNITTAFFGFGMFILFGFVYNVGLSKEAKFGFITIALSYVGLAIWSWSLSHSTVTIEGICFFIYIGLAIIVQIAIFGELKDIEHDKHSLVRSLGVEIKNDRMINTKKLQWIYTIGRGVMLIPLLTVLILTFNEYHIVTAVFICAWLLFSAVAFIFSTVHILEEQRWDRKKMLLRANIIELVVIFIPFPLFIPFWQTAIIIVIAVVLWALISKMIWKGLVQKI